MATRSVTPTSAVPRLNAGGYALLAVSTLGLFALCLMLARLPQPPTGGMPWLVGVIALFVVGVFGVKGVARGESLASKVVPAAAALILFLLSAEALLRAYNVPPGLIPTPSRIGQALYAAREVLLLDAKFTFVYEAFFGFVIGTVAGILLALLVVRYRFMERGLLPYAALLSSVPIVALAPVVIKAVGLGWISKTIIVAITVLFPVVINAVRGLHSASPMHLDLMHSYAANQAQTFRDVRWPSALPFIFTALKVGATLALINAIVAEFFGTEGRGLGFRIQIEVSRFNLDIVWAAIVVASILGISFYLLITWIEGRVLHRR